jgi:hypothetical protein
VDGAAEGEVRITCQSLFKGAAPHTYDVCSRRCPRSTPSRRGLRPKLGCVLLRPPRLF